MDIVAPDAHGVNDHRPQVNPLPYAALPHALVSDPALVAQAVRLAAILLRYALGGDRCWPSNRTLAEDLGWSVRTVSKYITQLKDAGWIRISTPGTKGCRHRVIQLRWRDTSNQPAQIGDAPLLKENRSREEKENHLSEEKSVNACTQRQRPEPEGRPRPVVTHEPPPTPKVETWTPAPPPEPLRPTDPPPRGRRGGLDDEDLRRRIGEFGPDPILEGELRRREEARRRQAQYVPPPEPQTVQELMGQLLEHRGNVPKLACWLAGEFKDTKSQRGYEAKIKAVWEGCLPIEALKDAYRQACGEKTKNPGAIFMTAIKRWERGKAC